MRFDDLDQRLRQYETAYDFCVPPENFIVVRLDGRGFTRQTKEVWRFEAPFDIRFRDLMAHTVRHLMQCGFNVAYGYSESDEISLLLRRDDDTFKRKTRKIISILASEAGAAFSVAHGQPAAFDARVCVLPNEKLVIDYFRWRQEDAHRNALNAHCYWMLRKKGKSVARATGLTSGLARCQKHDLLFENGINFNELPAWQKRGFAVYFQTGLKTGFNPQSGETVQTQRQILHTDFELPLGDDYSAFVHAKIK
ncbi:MAG: tRNA(His) guanylyltransferase Thg1 family protein [Neisseria sp.]|nr:tRNA(His) guanylyltransferase Thg1 family protein [Neisseria sp.]